MTEHLFTPFALGPHRLRNRIAHASITTRLQASGRVTEALIRYHVNRAKGGAALLVSEPLAFLKRQTQPKVQVWHPDAFDGLRRWADAIRAEDSLLLAQLQDPGRGRHHPGRSAGAIGPSALPDDLSWTMPHPLSTAEVRALIAEFAESSAILARAGFAGVEISAGHGHLFHQFLSPHSNRRDDAYGGTRENRVRLLAELLAALRDACGEGFLIGLKLPAEDGVAGSIDLAEAKAIASLLTSGAVRPDYVTFCTGAHARSLEDHLPDRYGPTVPWRPLFRALRPHCHGVPLMALGRITDPAEAEAWLASGEAELIGLGRPLIADPEWGDKARRGRAHDIRYCLSCNSCWGYGVMHNRSIGCVNNPRVGAADELADRFPPAAVRKRVVVVGGGVAGLEAAWVAAARGHDVTLISRGAEHGGRTRLRAQLPGGETITSIADWQRLQAERFGVSFRWGEDATAESVLALKPDAMVLATGADLLPPDWVPQEWRAAVPDLPTALVPLLARQARQPGTAVIHDMDHSDFTYAAAEFLTTRFDRVVIVTSRDSVAEDLWLVARQGILRRLSQRGVEVLRLHEPIWTDAIEDGALECTQVYTGAITRIEEVSFLAYATPRVPRTGLMAPLQAAGVQVIAVGDARSPQGLMEATEQGHAAGKAL
jgi:2,4-dienoyl-CoA reductase-like NADH-dependent reductase (Old Yellow Enzyme family)/thioredoxin reductase